MLFVVRCLLCVVLLCVVRCLNTCCLLLFFLYDVCRMLRVVCCLFVVVYSVLFIRCVGA